MQTIACQDCKQLYDAVTQLKVPDEGPLERQRKSLEMLACNSLRKTAAPSFAAAASLLTFRGLRRFKWLKFKPQCPVSVLHRIEEWKDPGRCPRCGLHLEKSVLPFRIWD
ncbi:MAG TPA: hypothetical protein VN673_10375 [Clostridia bacterium]|nr:hypothetical protein [Clostridia bacterium]